MFAIHKMAPVGEGSIPEGWRYTGTLAIAGSPRAYRSVRSFKNTRLCSTVTICQQTPIFWVLWDRNLSPVKANISVETKRGCRAGKTFVGKRLFSLKRKRKTRKKGLARYGRLCWLEKLPRRALVEGESPKVAAILWIAPIDCFFTGYVVEQDQNLLQRKGSHLQARAQMSIKCQAANSWHLKIFCFFF